MIKKGEKIERNGVVLSIANRDLRVCQERLADDFLLPDGSLPEPGELMPPDLIIALSEIGMEPT